MFDRIWAEEAELFEKEVELLKERRRTKVEEWKGSDVAGGVASLGRQHLGPKAPKQSVTLTSPRLASTRRAR